MQIKRYFQFILIFFVDDNFQNESKFTYSQNQVNNNYLTNELN